MPLLDRDTLVDRPVLVNRGDEEDQQDTKETEGTAVESLGTGGGPVIHQIEFEPGDYNLVAGANAAAVLATGEQGGEAFEQAFVNAALQLKDLQQQGEDIRDIARFGLEKGVAEIGLSMEDISVLREDTTQEPEGQGADEVQPEEHDTQEEQAEEDDEDEEGDGEVDADDDEDGSEDGEDGEDTTNIEEVEEDIEEVKEE